MKYEISDVGLSDNDIIDVEEVNGALRLHLMANDLPYLEITKEDVFDMAKHFGIIKGDENE